MLNWSLATMSDPSLKNAQEAARLLRETLALPASAATVSAWVQDGKTCLMVRVDPRYAGHVAVPPRFQSFKVEVRRKLPIKAH
jgi:hypothetical protein